MCIYLYVKTHNVTGLKYLGKTTSTDPHKYKGSGDYWKNHIKIHGYDVTTTILRECQTNEEVKDWGLYYSNLWNIVNACDEHGRKVWANFKPESGDGGSTKGRKFKRFEDREGMPDEIKEKISSAMKGRPAHNKGKKQSHKPHKPRQVINNKGKDSKLFGILRPRLCCVVCQKEVDVANLSKYHKHN